ncbi:biopolymer transporter ExbD (plasmid) [Paracoccus sp. TK19116]|uniref:Biopolymer transporter ExbD n=1 Tax=Paracoccus albicereus TaxID=2922394 RepID=A0ABT1MP07_9RHOB|nr:biopolymer transporter ExbD [Paracoccus albicereus]MCQ0969168.1 biopolymer transporter ExbD [Paracoccus albicereus]
MAGVAIHRIELPRRARGRTFTLTALADAMFQLLIFFMLSSNLTPYSLMPLRSGALAADASGGDDADGEASRTDVVSAQDTAIWSVSRDSIVSSGQRFGFDRLGDLAAAMQAGGTERVLLVTRPGAQVQGMVAVLEAVAAHGITDVQVASGGTGS